MNDMKSPMWHGYLVDQACLHEHGARAAHALADSARNGQWDEVIRLLIDSEFPWTVNVWRPGGKSWFTPLHQAAWSGAPVEIIEQLLALGAWRSLRNSSGKTAADIATECANDRLAELLKPDRRIATTAETFRQLDRSLAALIESRIRPQVELEMRFPQTEILTDLPTDSGLWVPVPGMYGGFNVQLMRSYLFVESWSRMVAGSGQAHVVTVEGFTLVEEGFV